MSEFTDSGETFDPPKAYPPWIGLALAFLAALLVRGAFAATQLPSLDDDPDAYRRLAVNLRQTGVYGFGGESDAESRVHPTAFRPPLYPLVLAAFVKGDEIASWKIAALHAVLGAATTALVVVVGYQARLGGWSYVAAGLTACDPILLNQSTVVMTETLAAFLAVVALAALSRFVGVLSPDGLVANRRTDIHVHRGGGGEEDEGHECPSYGAAGPRSSLVRAALVGVLLGLSVLCRPTFFFWLVFLVAAVLVRPGFPYRFRYSAALVAGAVVVLAPWTVRNIAHFGKPIFATTHGGYTVWLANNDWYYDYLLSDREDVFDARELLPRLAELRAEYGGGNELTEDRVLYREAKETIARRPGVFLYASAVRVGNLWRLTPRQVTEIESTRRTLARWAVGVWYAGVFALAAIGAFALGRRMLSAPWLGAVLLFLSFTLVHAVYWTDMRMRAPLMPAVSLFAAAGAARLAHLRSR